MQTGQQGQCALNSLTRILTRAAWRGLPALVLAVMCFIAAAPVHAAEQAKTETPKVRKASGAKPNPEKPHAKVAMRPLANSPDDDLAMSIFERGRLSRKGNVDVLTPLTGTWNYVESFWTRPKAKPWQATGSVTSEMIMDGRYLCSKSNGTLNLGREEIPVDGRELIGFDSAKKSFSFFAVDTLATGMTVGSGKFDAKAVSSGKKHGLRTGVAAAGGAGVMTETGRFTNPLTGVEQGFLSEIRFVDADHYTRTVFALGKSGKKSKLMEFDYSRSNVYTPPAKK